jgi:hypothetical protein
MLAHSEFSPAKGGRLDKDKIMSVNTYQAKP